VDFGIQPFSLRRLAQREGWVRKPPARRDLSAAARLLAEAEMLETATSQSAIVEQSDAASYLSPLAGERSRATSAFTRVFDALWRAGEGAGQRV
jgi:hypothetical protein